MLGCVLATPAITYQAPKNADALKEAKRLLDGHDIEIWQGARVVAYLVPDETKDGQTRTLDPGRSGNLEGAR